MSCQNNNIVISVNIVNHNRSFEVKLSSGDLLLYNTHIIYKISMIVTLIFISALLKLIRIMLVSVPCNVLMISLLILMISLLILMISLLILMHPTGEGV